MTTPVTSSAIPLSDSEYAWLRSKFPSLTDWFGTKRIADVGGHAVLQFRVRASLGGHWMTATGESMAEIEMSLRLMIAEKDEEDGAYQEFMSRPDRFEPF